MEGLVVFLFPCVKLAKGSRKSEIGERKGPPCRKRSCFREKEDSKGDGLKDVMTVLKIQQVRGYKAGRTKACFMA